METIISCEFDEQDGEHLSKPAEAKVHHFLSSNEKMGVGTDRVLLSTDIGRGRPRENQGGPGSRGTKRHF